MAYIFIVESCIGNANSLLIYIDNKKSNVIKYICVCAYVCNFPHNGAWYIFSVVGPTLCVLEYQSRDLKMLVQCL